MRTTATSIINVQQRWNLQDEHSLGSLVALLAEWILCWCEYFALFRPFKLVAQPRVGKFFWMKIHCSDILPEKTMTTK